MEYIATRTDKEILNQSEINSQIKIEILEKTRFGYRKVGEIQGEAIEDRFRKDADSAIRRSYNLTLIVRNSTLLISETSDLWLDKYLKISIGYLNIRTNNIHWYSMGIYLFTDVNYSYNATDKTLALSCDDLMCKLNGERGGELSGLETVLPAKGNRIKSAMYDVVTQLGGFSQCNIIDIGKDIPVTSYNPSPEYIPYDLTFYAGSTVYDVLVELRDLYFGHEIFFDDDGVFVCRRVPSGKDFPNVMTSKEMGNLVISERLPMNVKIKNSIEVWGKNITADRYIDVETTNGLIYEAITEFPIAFTNGLIISFTPSMTNETAASLKSYTTTMPLYDGGGNMRLPKGTLEVGKPCAFMVVNNKLCYLGKNQIYAEFKDMNPTSKFNIDKIGENRLVLSGGEYENIYSEDLAYQRAKYEYWKNTKMFETISVEMFLVPWLNVNQKVAYTSLNTGETHEYIIKTIDGSCSSGIMTVGMTRFYPDDPDYPF